MSQPFRTASGQTGRDAYVNEAAAIANAQRELDARMRALRETIAHEAPETFEASTDFAFSGARDAKHLVDYLLHGATAAAQMGR